MEQAFSEPALPLEMSVVVSAAESETFGIYTHRSAQRSAAAVSILSYSWQLLFP